MDGLRYLIFHTLLFFCIGSIFAIGPVEESSVTRYIYRHIGVHDGLPEGYIGSTFRIPDGRMAIWATDLIIWDGVRYERYHNGDLPYYELSDGAHSSYGVDDIGRLWLKRDHELRVFDLCHERYINDIDSIFRSMGLMERVSNFFTDDRGDFWFNTAGGICNYSREYGLRRVFTGDIGQCGELAGAGLSSDNRYTWLVFSDGTVAKLHEETGRIVTWSESMRGYVDKGSQVIIKPVTRDATAVMTDNAVGLVSNMTGEFTPVLPLNDNQVHKYTSLEVDAGGQMWVSRTKHGLYILSPAINKVEHDETLPLQSGGMMAQDIQHIYADTVSGGMWLSLHGSGILYCNEGTPSVEYRDLGAEAGFRFDEYINTMLCRSSGSTLVGTSMGVYVIDDENECVSRVYDGLDGKICRVLYEDSDRRLWVGTFADGLYCVENGKLNHVFHAADSRGYNKDYNNIRVLAEDHQGRIWAAVYGGIGFIDPDDGSFNPVDGNDEIFRRYGLVSDLLFNSDGHLIAACEKGVFVYNPYDGIVRPVFSNMELPGTRNPSRQRANSIAFDGGGNLWVATHIGIYVLTCEGDTVFYGIDHGFSSPVQAVYGGNGNDAWAVTASNVYRLELVNCDGGDGSMRIVSHSYIDDKSVLRGDQLSFSIATDGRRLMVPAVKGYVSVDLQELADIGSMYRQCRPFFNYLCVSGQNISAGDLFNGRVLYDKPLGVAPGIVLGHNETNLSVGFVNLDFNNLSTATYRYKLDGIDDGWIEMAFSGAQGMVNYSGLRPGTYHLRVCCVNGGNEIGPESVFTIVVSPPWWLTTWFKVLWCLFILLSLTGVLLWVRRRNARRLGLAIERQEEMKRKEMEEMKMRFFSNISHELRTPLTMVITPLQTIIDKMGESSPLHSKLCGILQNANELLMQINHLLDFRKLEVGAERFEPRSCNIVDLTRVAASAFSRDFKERDIEFDLDLPQYRVVVNADKPKMQGVLTNIMSNALKYTPDGGKISVSLRVDKQAGEVIIEVSDSGIGIPAGELEKIFERYYRASNCDEGNSSMASSGIGLHMVREYMRMHEGDVSVVSELGKGSVFTLRLPLPSVDGNGQVSEESLSGDDTRPLVLLAEDNDEFRKFMLSELSVRYRVIGVPDGVKALEQARHSNPDIIISDVMMPGMSGIELVRTVKADIKVSHIPIVLLTAHANESDESDGYEAGADAYISKPFNMQVLLMRVANLIEQRRVRWEKFSRHVEVNPSEISITSPDEELISKALKCVEENMDESDFSVDDLSSALAMSTATMYRKLQAITGQTPNNFIRTLRLKRAAQLLRQTTLSVSEIAYRTGFSTPRYFSRLFKDEFGTLPTDYRKVEGDRHQQ